MQLTMAMAEATKLRLFFKQALRLNSPFSSSFTTMAGHKFSTLSPPLWPIPSTSSKLLGKQQPSLLEPFAYFQHQNPFFRFFSNEISDPTDDKEEKKKPINTKVNFSLSDSDPDSDTENDREKKIDNAKMPPPYDPFNKKPVIEEPDDPSNLQLIFHKMSSDGLHNNAVKMFDALSKDGLTHEALQLFSQIKDKGHMPDVVAYTAVIEAYANAGGQSKEAVKTFMKMLAAGVAPNAYTYTVLIRGLARDGKLADSNKFVLEMMAKGIRPNARTYTAVFEAYAKAQRIEEAKVLLQEMKGKGFVPDEKAVREVLKNKRGQEFRTVISILFDK